MTAEGSLASSSSTTLYCFAIKLNNIGVDLLEKGCVGEAHATFKHALRAMKLSSTGSNPPEQEEDHQRTVEAAIRQAMSFLLDDPTPCKPLAGVTHVEVMHYRRGQPICSVSNPVMNTGGCERFETRICPIRIEIDDCSFLFQEERCLELESAVLLHNMGTTSLVTFQHHQQKPTPSLDDHPGREDMMASPSHASILPIVKLGCRFFRLAQTAFARASSNSSCEGEQLWDLISFLELELTVLQSALPLMSWYEMEEDSHDYGDPFDLDAEYFRSRLSFLRELLQEHEEIVRSYKIDSSNMAAAA